MVAISFSVRERSVDVTNIKYSTEAFRNVIDGLHDVEVFASLCLLFEWKLVAARIKTNKLTATVEL